MGTRTSLQVCVKQHFQFVLHIHTQTANKTMELSEREEPRQRHGKVNEAFASEVSHTFDLSDRRVVSY